MENIFMIIMILLGFTIGYIVRLYISRKKLNSAENLAKKIIEDAKQQKETLLSDAMKAIDKERRDAENEFREKKQQLNLLEKKLAKREEDIDRRANLIERKERELEEKIKWLSAKGKALEEERSKIRTAAEEQQQILQRISSISPEEAKRMLLKNVEEESRREMANLIYQIEKEAKEVAVEKAKEIIATAIQRLASEYVNELTVTTIHLPSDEIKGRIIGREGRNIRTFEQLTGVDVIIDDTPETIVISCTDPQRREIAKIALEQLIADTRIQPARIEEVINKVKEEFETYLIKVGKETALKIGITELPDEVYSLIGKLKFKTSYGQNLLQHTIEVAQLATIMAHELDADVDVCKRAAIYHDIGKAFDHTVEGTHHELSAKLAKKYNESERVINAIISHHEGYERPKSVEAFIVAAADAISASRLGARKESVEAYVKRIESLEKIAMSFKGVSTAYAIQAGREVRVMVKPDIIDDASMVLLAKDIAKKIQSEINYPGQIKICVIRETRVEEFVR